LVFTLRAIFALSLLLISCRGPQNVFLFCSDFNEKGCVNPIENGKVHFSGERLRRNKTIRDFANDLYFRGDRVAFEIKNAAARWDITFECLRGHYYIDDNQIEKHELEYIELRDKNVYGLVLAGSLIEKKFLAIKAKPYRKLDAFQVTYTVNCGKDLLARQSIAISAE